MNDNGLIIARDEVMSSTGASLNPPVYTLDATDTDMEWTGNDTVFANSLIRYQEAFHIFQDLFYFPVLH